MPQIIATLGPVSDGPEQICELVDMGASFLRLNFSHGDHEEHGRRIARIRESAPAAQIVMDTKGADIRTGVLPAGEVLEVETGDILMLTTILKEQDIKKKLLFVDHGGITHDVEVDDKIAVDSGQIMLQVKEKHDHTLKTRVLAGGVIGSRRHVNLVGRDTSLPTITDQDREDLAFAAAQEVDVIALSFTRHAEDIREARALVPSAQIWAKIENKTGLDNLDEILAEADGVMVARGDLGVETPFVELPARQAEVLNAAHKAGKFSIVATEMMESMIKNIRPTRAEVADVSLAVWQGANAIMLSAETAVGAHPALCVKIMRKIAAATRKYREERWQPK